jgi:hypothetical protein
MTKRLYLTQGALLALALNTLHGQTSVGLRTQSKDVDFRAATATAPFKTGTTLPSACQTGEAFFKTDATAGQNLYGCVATNVWAVQSSGGGSALPFNDFQSAVNGQMLTIAEGRARIGNYVPVVIATGSVTFTSGSGNVKVFIDSSNNLVCHMQTGIAASTSGALTCSNVSTPTYPANSIPIANVTVTDAVPSLTSDDRAFLTTRGINDSGGLASIGIDTATVPQLGAGSNDFTGAISALELRLLSGSEGACSSLTRGRIVMVFGSAGTADTIQICSKDGADAYGWRTLL